MPISVSCVCGKTLSVKDELAGKRGKCPACGVMLTIPQLVKPLAKPVEDEWGLAPLDDEKPAQPAPKSAAAKPGPASKSPVNGSIASATGNAASAVPVKKPSLGGPVPAFLDLPPLDDDLFAKPAAASKPVNSAKPSVSAAKTPSSSAATKSLGGAAPAPLDLAPLAGGEEQNHAAWIDIGSESHFTVTGAPLSSNTGQIFAAPVVAAPVAAPPGGHPGDLLCPFCNKDLDTITVADVQPQIWLGALTGFWMSVAPFKCRNCGPIQFEQLIGESKITVKKRAAAKDRAFFKGLLIFLLIIGVIVSVPMYIMPWWNSWRQAVRHQEALEKGEQMRLEMEERRKASKERFDKEFQESQQRFNMPPMPGNFPTGPMPGPQTPRPAQPIPQPRPKSKQEAEEMHKKNEERRRQYEERVKKMQEQSKQPATTRPNPAPPMTTPMKPASPFEETTVPPATPPTKAAPVNPFQPVD